MTVAFIDLLGVACIIHASNNMMIADSSTFLVDDKEKHISSFGFLYHL